jgi:hypothetical protein
MPEDWSRAENEALVASYLAMLAAELRGEAYSKTAHRRTLAPLLDGRSNPAIERKLMNVSAVMIELGYPYISGYKRLPNYQSSLLDAVVECIAADPAFTSAVRTAVELPAQVPTLPDLLDRWEKPPAPCEPVTYRKVGEDPRRLVAGVNYLEREARNSSLGRAGEVFVLRFERARLIRAGRHALADRVEHVSVTQGDGAGFDVHSFEPNGRDRLIEVKTTAYGKETPFFVSRNEVAVSRRRAEHFHLYRLFRFRQDPRLYGLRGALGDTCRLDAIQFTAQVK